MSFRIGFLAAMFAATIGNEDAHAQSGAYGYCSTSMSSKVIYISDVYFTPTQNVNGRTNNSIKADTYSARYYDDFLAHVSQIKSSNEQFLYRLGSADVDCSWYPTRQAAVTERSAWLERLKTNTNGFRGRPMDYAFGGVPTGSRKLPGVPPNSPALTVVSEDPAIVRKRERAAEQSRRNAELAAEVDRRKKAMDRAVQEIILANNLALQRRVALRVAEIQRRRAACRAGDRSACRTDLRKSGASNQ